MSELKHKKVHNNLNKNKIIKKKNYQKNTFYIISYNYQPINSWQIEAARRVITRTTKRTGALYININPKTPITSKPIGSRMGKGAGKVKHLICNVSPGEVIFTLKGVTKKIGIKALQLASKKLPIRAIVIGNI